MAILAVAKWSLLQQSPSWADAISGVGGATAWANLLISYLNWAQPNHQNEKAIVSAGLPTLPQS